MSANYKTVKNGYGTKLEIGPGRYISIGRDGNHVVVRGNGRTVGFPSWEAFVSAIDVRKSSYCVSEKTVEKKVGECVVDREGVILVLRRECFGQGWIFKDWGAFYHEPQKPCYVPELSEKVYTRADFLSLCKGQEDIAEMVFEGVDWQCPEVYLDEQYRDGELDTCGFCGNIFKSHEADRCPYCGASRREKE